MTKIILNIIILTFIVTSCGSKMAGGSVDADDIDSAVIIKCYNSAIADTTKRLTNNSIEIFVDKWNNSPSSGPWKFIPGYELTFYFKNNKTKTFRVAGQNVKEQNDWCIDFNDTTFFDKLWTDN